MSLALHTAQGLRWKKVAELAHNTAQRLSWKKVAGLGSHAMAQRLNWKKVAELALQTHTGTAGLPDSPSKKVGPGLHGVDTPEKNDSRAESHGLSQNEYVEPRDHPVRAPCPLLSHLQLLIQLIEEHPHIALLIVGRDNCFKSLHNWPPGRTISAAT